MSKSSGPANKSGNRSGMGDGSQKVVAKNRFKPGQSGNPAGRPKGARGFKTVIREILDCVMANADVSGLSADLAKSLEVQLGRRPSRRELLVYVQVCKAMAGDTYAFDKIADREEGKPKQEIELDADIDHRGKVKFMDLEERLKLLEDKE